MKPPSKQRRPTIARLIRRVAGSASVAFWKEAVEQLAARGAQAVGPVLKAMHGPVPPGQHPRDMVENLGMVLCAMARRDPGPLIDVLERNAAPCDPQLMFVVWALAEAPKAQALPPLIRALKHAHPTVRLSAAEALIALRSKRAIGPLVEALRDRAPMVRATVVHTMHDSTFFRTPAAIEPLRAIVRSTRAKRQSPGTWRMAVDLIARLEDRPNQH
jgi:hypothetical protein